MHKPFSLTCENVKSFGVIWFFYFNLEHNLKNSEKFEKWLK